MLTPELYNRIETIWPMLSQADARTRQEFRESSIYARIPANHDVFIEGDRVDAIALLLSGAVRVYKIGETGREITLYRFGSGESCILTANAILSNQTFSAIATAESDLEAIMIPSVSFREWVRRSDVWQTFLFDLLSQRLASVMEIVDEVAFRRMDIRVARLLFERLPTANPVNITHQEIAAELGSSREVISRILESLAGQGLVHMGRGTIEVLDMVMLKSYTER